MKKKWKALVLGAGLILALGVGACGRDTNDNNRPEGTKLTIFIASDKLAGTNEGKVKTAVEEKFWKDTGISVDLNVQLQSKSDFATTMTNAMASDSWDAASSYLGIAGVDDNLIRQNAALDISSLLSEYGQNILEKDTSISSLKTVENRIYGVTSVSETRQYGILIRKDWMHRAGYTDDESETEYTKLETMGQFVDMLTKFRSIPGCSYPLAGAPWDLEYVLTSGVVEGHPSYATNTVFRDEAGKVTSVGPGYLDKNYSQVLGYIYDWERSGLWESYESATTYATRERWFVQGQVGVYVGNPKVTELIRVARNLKANDPDAEVTIIGPLAAGDAQGNFTLDAEGNKIAGFREEDAAYSGLVVNPRSKNADLVIKYLNWMYSDVKNYELCAYGIEGSDWVDAGEGKYAYPEGKEELYIKNPSYSGGYRLVENINMSNRILTSYTETELRWIEAAKQVPTYESATNGIFLNKPSDTVYQDFLNAQNRMMTNIIYKAWNGGQDPRLYHWNDETNGVAGFRKTANAYLEWMTQQYLFATA